MIIEYNTSVHVPAGWRGISIVALAEKISEKRCQVTNIISIDGECPKPDMTRTGANRQKYFGFGVVKNEIGKIKNISSLKIKEV